MSDRTSDEQGNLRRLIAAGADIVGAGAGASIGYVLGGTAGAGAGGMYGAMARIMLQDVALDFTHRLLGEREEARVGAAVYYFAEKYQEKLDAGQRPRQDDFFDDPPDDRAAAKEVFEGTLLAAQREHQEKKLRFYGNLVANIAFHPEVSREQANFLVGLGETLSYRQLCFLRIFALNEANRVRLRDKDYQDALPLSAESVSLLQELWNLYNRGLLYPSGKAVLGVINIVPGDIYLQGIAATLHNLMELHQIPDAEVIQATQLLF